MNYKLLTAFSVKPFIYLIIYLYILKNIYIKEKGREFNKLLNIIKSLFRYL